MGEKEDRSKTRNLNPLIKIDRLLGVMSVGTRPKGRSRKRGITSLGKVSHERQPKRGMPVDRRLRG